MAIGSHHSPVAQKDEWLTPPEIIRSLGAFDLDPCAPIARPWDTAARHLTIVDDGLSAEWSGRVWLNPPYGLEAARWLARMKAHRNGTALIFARTETRMFFDYVWSGATALLFIEGRLHFHHVSGERAANNSGAPSVLIAYSQFDADALDRCGIPGKVVRP